MTTPQPQPESGQVQLSLVDSSFDPHEPVLARRAAAVDILFLRRIDVTIRTRDDLCDYLAAYYERTDHNVYILPGQASLSWGCLGPFWFTR